MTLSTWTHPTRNVMPETTTTTPHSPRSDENSTYPFTDGATFLSRDNKLVDKQSFVDAIVYPSEIAEDVHISQIDLLERSTKIVLQDSQQGVVARGETSSEEPNSTMVLKDKNNLHAGIILVNIDQLRSGFSVPTVLRFGSEALPFTASVVIPRPDNHVSGIRLPSGKIISGEVWLVGEDGIVLDHETQGATDVISIHAIGDRYATRRVCEASDETFTPTRPVKKIVVKKGSGTEYEISPDQWGNIQISQGLGVEQDNVIRLNSEKNSIRFNILGNFN